MKVAMWVLAAGGLFVLCGCELFGMIDPETKATAVEGITNLVKEGVLTQGQADAMIASIAAGDWTAIRDELLTMGLSVAGALTGIRIVRGPSASKSERVARKVAKLGAAARQKTAA